MELPLAYTHGREEIRTLKGIARSVSNRDRLSLACALPLICRLLPLFTKTIDYWGQICEDRWTRTIDKVIKSHLLYQLSYVLSPPGAC
jgi:hypothetical protein